MKNSSGRVRVAKKKFVSGRVAGTRQTLLGTKHYQFTNFDFWCKCDTWDAQKRHIISPGSQTELQDISSSKKTWINVFSGPKTSKIPLSSWDTGVQKSNERKSQNSILSLLRAFSLSETKTNFKNELKSAASQILTFFLQILPHYQNHQNARCVLILLRGTKHKLAIDYKTRWHWIDLTYIELIKITWKHFTYFWYLKSHCLTS